MHHSTAHWNLWIIICIAITPDRHGALDFQDTSRDKKVRQPSMLWPKMADIDKIDHLQNTG